MDGEYSVLDDSPEEQDELISDYMARVFPVFWVRWWLNLPHCSDKAWLAGILFDESDHLQDMTDPEIREKVLGCVQGGTQLRAMVLEEIDGLLEQYADELAGQVSTEDSVVDE